LFHVFLEEGTMTRFLRRFSVLLLALLLAIELSTLQAHAQNRVITGRVTDAETKRPLAGVKVQVKGSNIGALTSNTGGYSISANAGQKLVFMYVGMKKQEITVGEQSTIDVAMAIDAKLLDDIVVTALGIEREKRAVNYAVQEVKAGEIAESAQQNMISALQGRIAGVQITNAGGAPGAGVSIIMRGGNSVDSDNQPLIVLDGVPMDNTTNVETNAGTSSMNGILGRSVSSSNRGIDINPDDIESISVLRGASASALYGSRAANGVLLITTKRGFKERVDITYNGQGSYDVVNKLPETQSLYKQGTNGFFSNTTRLSWGPRFQSGESIYENIREFFVPAVSQQHNLTMSGAGEKLNFYFSAQHFNQNGIVPNTSWNRTSIRFNGGANLSKVLKLNTSINFINSGGNRALQGPGLFGGSGGFFVSMIFWPKNDNMKDWQSPDGTRRRLLASVTEDIDNPYFTLNRNTFTDNVDRLLGNVNLVYEPVEWLSVNYRFGIDTYNEFINSVRVPGSSLPGSQQGSLAQSKNYKFNWNSQLLITAKQQLTEDVKGDITVGNWIESEYSNATDWYGQNFINPDFISINNTVLTTRQVAEAVRQRRLFAFFGMLNLSWKDRVYLTVKARNDWSSTLPINNRSYFYPSVDVGYAFSEDLAPLLGDVLNFGRLRVSYARVGKDASPYRTGTALTVNTFVGGGFRNDFWAGNPILKPEITESYEAGLDMQFLDNRIGIDLTLYQQRTINQLIAPRVSQASGFIFAYLNGGIVENRGVELLLNFTPVRSQDLTWNTTINFTRNFSLVSELPSVLTELNQSGAWVIDNARGSAFPGQPLQAISVNDFLRNREGKILIDSLTGYPRVQSNANWFYGGNRQPDASIGWTNTLSFEHWTFSMLWDIRIGGNVVNGTEWAMMRAGMSKRTEDRYRSAVLDGVVARVSGGDTTFTPNTRVVELTETYYRNIYAFSGRSFVEDASWVRLRSVGITYKMPKTWFEGTPISGLELSLIGRNLLLFTRYTGMDPEVSSAGAGVGGAGSNGMDYGGVPATMGATFGLRLSF
jgi:TonB-linked SusC/RagA family outer membrane protein